MSTCPTCETEFSRLGTHFQWRPDHRPELTDRQRAICDYLALSGVNVRGGSCPYLEVFGTDRDRLEALADALRWLAHDVRPHARDRAGDRRDLYSFTTVPHPSLDYGGPTNVERLRPLTARLLVVEGGTFVGTILGSLQLDCRGYVVSGEHLRTLLARGGVVTVEWDGDGYATDTHTCRYHWHPEVVVVPHYDAVDLLDWAGLSVSDVAEPIKLR